MPVPSLENHSLFEGAPKQDPVQIQPKDYKGVTVDTKLVNFELLTTYIAGQAWDVEYFEQQVGRDDAIKNFQQDLDAPYQVYRRIRGLELKVTSPLTEGSDRTTKDVILTGTATVYGIFVPKEGDMFFADIGDGREGMFAVTSANRLSHYETAPHEIEYSLTCLVDQTINDAVMHKVIETVYFKKDFMTSGSEPLLHKEEVDIVNRLEGHYTRLMAMYFNDFYSRTLKSLLVPNQPFITYDPFVVKFLKTVLDTDEHPMLRHVIEFNVSEDQAMYEFTLWNCLSQLDYSMLPMCVHEAGIVDVVQFFSRPVFNSVYYSGVQAVVYPDMVQTNVDAGYNSTGRYVPPMNKMMRGRTRFAEMDRVIRQDTLELDPTLEIYEASGPDASPAIRRVTVDNYYVLSEGFYKDNGMNVLSRLEVQTLAALKGEALDIRVLDKLCDGARFWDNVERFYYFPILFVLLRIYQRRLK
jgi:hypothetical protein